MYTSGGKMMRVLWALVLLLTAGRVACAQTVRGQVNIAAPGTFTGLRGPAYNFSTRSYGLGALGGSGGPASNVLRSSVSGAADYGLGRSSGAAAAMTNLDSLPKLAPTGRKYETGVGNLLKIPAGATNTGQQQDLSSLLAGTTYMEAASSLAEPKTEAGSRVVRSLVPGQPSIYRDFMARADRAFRLGDYSEAANQYRCANHLASRNPESLLGMAHAQMAAGLYGSAAWSLKEAIKYLPELPLVRLEPEAFFARDPNDLGEGTARYREQKLALEEYVRRYSYDANGHLLLAYLQWFEDRPQEAKASLASALRAARENPSALDLTGMGLPDPTIEAIDTFWRAMLASGKVTGTLHAETQPATGPA